MDKSLGIKITSNAKGTTSSLDAVTSSLKSMKSELAKTGATVKSFKTIQNAAGEYKKAIVTATKGNETFRISINKLGQTTGIQTITKHANKAKSSLSQMFSLGKIYAFWNMTTRVREGIKNMIKSSIDFVETTNKFEVSMGKMEDSAYRFINTISERFGLAREELMNYQSTYNNIMKSLSGITDETAYKISESITEMAIDYASLYNVSTEEAMTKFQSALVGSVRPIRSESGYDITETTIGEKAKELGVETPVRQLTQMEKRLLRIMVLMDQMKKTGSMGDFARTIEQPANQLKILSNQVKELGVWLGNVFLGTLGKILPYVNGFVMVLKELAKMLAFFVGYENVGSIAGPLEDASDSTGDMADNLGSAASKAKELKKILMGFDVLNVITTPTKSDSGAGSVGTVDPKILAAMQEYDNLMENVSMKATAIRDKIMEWLGFTKSVNEETGEITWKLNEGYTNLEKIGDAIKVIGILFASWKVAQLFSTIKKIFTTIGNSKAFKTISGLATSFFAWVKGGENAAFAFEALKKQLAAIGKKFGIIGGIITAIKGVIDFVKQLKTNFENLGESFLAVGEIIVGIGAAVGLIFGGWIPALIGALVGAVGVLITTIVTKWEEIGHAFKVTWQSALDGWEIVKGKIKQSFDNAISWIKDKLSILGNAFKTTWQSVQDGWDIWMDRLKEGIDNIKSKIDGAITWVKDKFTVVGNAFKTTWQSVQDGWTLTVNKIKTKATEFKDKVSGAVDSVKNKFSSFGTSIKDAIGGIKNKWTDFKNNFTLPKIKTPHFTWTSTPAKGWIKDVLEALNIPAAIPKLNVEWYAKGGLPDVGEMFVAREAGPELVGTIGNKSAVVNNDQIVEAVSRGVAQAVSSVMGSNGGSYHLYIDGQEITDVVTRRMSRTANITGGYAYGQ